MIPIPGGGVGVVSADRPNSAYVAYPGVEYQMEVYHPDPAEVRRLVRGGAVKPVPTPRPIVEPRGPVAVSEKDLVALSEEPEHPVYWAGQRANTTYELTLTSDGSVFVRYLPPGAEVGASDGALTVATYPVASAYSVTQKGASGEGSVVVQVPGDGFAMHSKRSKTNVYLAFPGEDVQVECTRPCPVRPRSSSHRERSSPSARGRRIRHPVDEHAARSLGRLPAPVRRALLGLQAPARACVGPPPAGRASVCGFAASPRRAVRGPTDATAGARPQLVLGGGGLRDRPALARPARGFVGDRRE